MLSKLLSIFLSIFIGIIIGLGIGYTVFFITPIFPQIQSSIRHVENNSISVKPQVIGFLPYWLLDKAQTNYAKYLTSLAYFSLTVDTDGTIRKMASSTESDPGWYALKSGKADSFLQTAQNNQERLSLVVFNGNNDMIYQFLDDPKTSAQNLMSDISPVMKQNHFTDLNLDIESTKDATNGAQKNFTTFVKTISQQMKSEKLGTLSIDVAAGSYVTPTSLVIPSQVIPYVDSVIIMAYDFHSPGSSVTGPVAPIGGYGKTAEYDITTALQKALTITPAQKIILGAPLYGYGWETLDPSPRSAVIPGTGITMSGKTVNTLLSTCTNCKVTRDKVAQESYVVYKDTTTGTYHQIFYPDQNSTQMKINLVQNMNLGGLAFWALGYENGSILTPLEKYK